MDEHHHSIVALLGEQIQYCQHLERPLLPGESQALLNLCQAAKVTAPAPAIKSAKRRKAVMR